MDQKQREEQLTLQQQVYLPLGPRQTRLLRIHPSTDTRSEIICDLFAVALGKKSGAIPVGDTKSIGYEALSYTWGNPEATEKIQVNKLAFLVSKNLYDALQHIRLPGRDRFLWTDACCINQSNLAEKARQVEMMFSIYLKASGVVVWLGRPTPEDSQVFNLIESVGKLSLYDRKEACQALGTRRAASQLIETKAWFQRTWVRQEVHAARKVQIVCGKHSCSFEDFEAVMDDLLPDMGNTLDLFKPNRDPTDPAYRAKMLYVYFKRDCDTYHFPEQEMHNMWFRIIMRSSLYESTLPQDKIFAVLGIAAKMTKRGGDPRYVDRIDSTQGFPEIDYSKPVSLVYQDFLKHTINTSGHLGCLSVIQNRAAIGDDLPSWAIDLRRNVSRFIIPLGMFDFGRTEGYRLMDQDYNEHGILRLWGRRIGVISSTTSPWVDGLQREVTGQFKTPGLESCFSSNDHWHPRKEGNKGMEETFGIMERRCSYVWTVAKPDKKRIMSDVSEDRDFDPTKHQCHAFVSHLVQEGDLIVYLCGATVPFIIRPKEEGDRYTFLGPAILTVGFVKKLKGREMFRYSSAQCYDLREEPGEVFVLV